MTLELKLTLASSLNLGSSCGKLGLLLLGFCESSLLSLLLFLLAQLALSHLLLEGLETSFGSLSLVSKIIFLCLCCFLHLLRFTLLLLMLPSEPLFFGLLRSSSFLSLLCGVEIRLRLATMSSGWRWGLLGLCLGLLRGGWWDTLLFRETGLSLSLSASIILLSLAKLRGSLSSLTLHTLSSCLA